MRNLVLTVSIKTSRNKNSFQVIGRYFVLIKDKYARSVSSLPYEMKWEKRKSILKKRSYKKEYCSGIQ